jgi:hypothetical protein
MSVMALAVSPVKMMVKNSRATSVGVEALDALPPLCPPPLEHAISKTASAADKIIVKDRRRFIVKSPNVRVHDSYRAFPKLGQIKRADNRPPRYRCVY